MNKFSYAFLLFILFQGITFGQKKVLNAVLTTEKITVDGKLDEKSWKDAPIATDFVNYAPDNGKPIPYEKRTEVQIVYDNDAIYILAKMFDNEPDKILRQLSQRDNSSVSDKFGVYINGYNDGQQDYQFYVSAAGVQADCIATADGNADYNWNAVWDSEAKITDYGWVVEFKIPYAAIRFPSKKNQVWGLNFYREIRRERYEYTWNLIDNNITNEAVQAGILEGINDIKTPTRLFFNPYASYYLTEGETAHPKGELKGGLDIKYGINDAFTLDVILVPDFGQTKYDNVILNLSPFEQQFNENRPFFTEGVDLFSKGDLLYTRRVGGRPSYYPPLIENDSVVETIEQFPSTVNLINAFKISGRTNKGLGIGILNAITSNTTAEITKTTTDPDDDSIVSSTRSEVVEPLANYNEIVLDQRISNNSSVSIVNTNVIRDGEFRDANVSALVYDLNSKKNTFNVSGDFKYSFVNNYGNEEDTKGYDTSLNLGKTSGKIRFGGGLQYVSEDYDNNDMGINFQTHYQAYFGNVSYRILEPTKTFNSINSSLNLYSEFDNQSGKIQAADVNYSINFQTLKNDWFGAGLSGRPTEIYNFYEPRSIDDSVYLIEPENINARVYLSSNYNRKFALDATPSIRFFNQEDRMNYALSLTPRYRFNDHFSLIYDFYYFRQNNNIGWVDFDEFDNTIMARRNVISYENSLEAKYAINNTMNINLSVRYYWSYTTNFEYYNLQNDGTIVSNPNYNTNKNLNFNDWNFYLYYSWWFAPGSEMVVLYRNNSSLYEREFKTDIVENLQNVTNLDNLLHVFSISVRYHLDYNTLRKK